MRIGAPVVFAADVHPDRVDRQLIGWRTIIKGDRGTLFRSTIKLALATDRVPAKLSERWWEARGVGYWTVAYVQIHWYRNGRIVARDRLSPRYYRYRPSGVVFSGGCSAY